MNLFLWILQALAALLYGSSGIMKLFLFDKISADVPSFGAMPRPAWQALGVLELLCTLLLILPDALHWHPSLTIAAAAILAIESLIFIWVHLKYHERSPIILSAVLGLIMAFIVFGRLVLSPIL